MRRILCALLVGVMIVFLSAQAQILSTHEIVRVLSAQGDVTASDLQPALGQWQLELYNLPNRTDFFSAQYLVDADENGKFEVGLDPVYEITGQPKLVTAHVKVFCGSPQPFVEIRVQAIVDSSDHAQRPAPRGEASGHYSLSGVGRPARPVDYDALRRFR
jgi:hypothetical protein